MIRKWEIFWFEDVSPKTLAIFRVLHGSTLLLYMATWWLHSSEWLTAKGFHLSDEPIPPLESWALPLFGTIQFGGLFLLIFGVFPRSAALGSFFCLLYVSLVDRVASYSINSIYLFTLAVLAAYLPIRKHQGPIPVAPVRLLQVALVAIYFSSGWHKAVYGDWLDSPNTLWTTVQGIYMTAAAAWALRTFPETMWTILQYAILTFELLAPVLFFSRLTRRYAIWGGCVFHLGIAVFMDKLIFFSLQMMSFYVLFPARTRQVQRQS